MNMSNRRHTLTRDQVLLAYANDQIARTSLKTEHFAQALSRALFDKCPDKAIEKDVPDFESDELKTDTTEFLKAGGRWLKRVQRWLDGSVELPSWTEEGWVSALEPEWRDRCINELAGRYDLIGARMPQSDFCPVSAFGRLVLALGGAVEACSTILADGKIDENDREDMPGAIHHLRAVLARGGEELSPIETQARAMGLDTHRAGNPVH